MLGLAAFCIMQTPLKNPTQYYIIIFFGCLILIWTIHVALHLWCIAMASQAILRLLLWGPWFYVVSPISSISKFAVCNLLNEADPSNTLRSICRNISSTTPLLFCVCFGSILVLMITSKKCLSVCPGGRRLRRSQNPPPPPPGASGQQLMGGGGRSPRPNPRGRPPVVVCTHGYHTGGLKYRPHLSHRKAAARNLAPPPPFWTAFL